jgi:hypothetical protein
MNRSVLSQVPRKATPQEQQTRRKVVARRCSPRRTRVSLLVLTNSSLDKSKKDLNAEPSISLKPASPFEDTGIQRYLGWGIMIYSLHRPHERRE